MNFHVKTSGGKVHKVSVFVPACLFCICIFHFFSFLNADHLYWTFYVDNEYFVDTLNIMIYLLQNQNVANIPQNIIIQWKLVAWRSHFHLKDSAE